MNNPARANTRSTRAAGAKGSCVGLAAAAVLILGAVCTVDAAETAPKSVNTQAPYPASVSLVHEAEGWTYRQSGTSAPLYFNQKDSPSKSVCGSACETQWYPLIAQTDDKKTIGEWTSFRRKDGRRQWAFRNRPVYTHIHDSPDKPIGDGEGGTWHVLPHLPTPIGQS